MPFSARSFAIFLPMDSKVTIDILFIIVYKNTVHDREQKEYLEMKHYIRVTVIICLLVICLSSIQAQADAELPPKLTSEQAIAALDLGYSFLNGTNG